jgi:hypothetical protein
VSTFPLTTKRSKADIRREDRRWKAKQKKRLETEEQAKQRRTKEREKKQRQRRGLFTFVGMPFYRAHTEVQVSLNATEQQHHRQSPVGSREKNSVNLAYQEEA